VARISCSVLCSVKGGASRWIDQVSAASAMTVQEPALHHPLSSISGPDWAEVSEAQGEVTGQGHTRALPLAQLYCKRAAIYCDLCAKCRCRRYHCCCCHWPRSCSGTVPQGDHSCHRGTTAATGGPHAADHHCCNSCVLRRKDRASFLLLWS
jgi:hypothetical protein